MITEIEEVDCKRKGEGRMGKAESVGKKREREDLELSERREREFIDQLFWIRNSFMDDF